MYDFKIRASSAASIIGGSIGLGKTDQAHLDLCSSKRSEGKTLTVNQSEKESEILKKLEDPNSLIPQGLKTYCEVWLKEQLYMRKKRFTAKQTDKGILVEDSAIEYIKEQLNLGFALKNEKHFYNDFMMGTPDIILSDWIIDAKSSWDFDTFPLFEEKLDSIYFWQGQVYMALTGSSRYTVAYCLMDMPEELLEKETNKAMYQISNQGKTYDEIFEKLQRRYTFSGLPDELRFKKYDFNIDEKAIAHIEERVVVCRNYIQTELIPKISKETINEIKEYSLNANAA
jgi:hypothetical protein